MFSYSGYSMGFVLFWGAMCCTCVGLLLAKDKAGWEVGKIERIENHLFWLFGIAMLAFSGMRPLGIARDDLGYLGYFNALCPTLDCGKLVQGNRDWGWYSLVGFLKSFVPKPEVMLWLSAVGLFAKLFVIFKVCRYPMLGLLLFAGIFYQIQDLTAFRVAFSLAIFMLAIYAWLVRGKTLGTVVLLLSGIFHKQGYVSIGLVIAPLFRRWYWVLALAMLLPFTLLWLFGKPVVPTWLSHDRLAHEGLDSYVASQLSGAFQKDKLIPLSLYPLGVLGLWLAKDTFETNRELYAVVAASMTIACWLMWLFAAITPVQVRFFEYFMLPMVLLAGCAKRNVINLVLIAAVAGSWVVRHNILNQLIG